jgi:isopentenyl-diphosphate Delta-isomerase
VNRFPMIDAEEQVVLVDEQDRPLGARAKLEAHRDAARHRAFSVFLFDDAGAVLLQSRALSKYHSPGLWSNACCGHPRVGEPPLAAARRRLYEELGLKAALSPAGRIAYAAELPGGWYENEIVHLFTGRCAAAPRPDPAEVGAWRWTAPDALAAEYRAQPDAFTAWFKIYLERIPEVALGRA